MTRNTYFSAIMFAMMAMFSTSMMAQGHGHRNAGSRGYSIEMGATRGGVRHDMHPARMNHGYDAPRHHGYDAPHHHDMDHMGAPHHRGFREMHGHRWDMDGWMEGYYGRVRHFDDGRWGYLRDGRWYYYDCFYEPDYYFARPLAHFHSHIMTPSERRIVGAAVGVAAVATLISALTY